jgi:hypothetical protein
LRQYHLGIYGSGQAAGFDLRTGVANAGMTGRSDTLKSRYHARADGSSSIFSAGGMAATQEARITIISFSRGGLPAQAPGSKWVEASAEPTKGKPLVRLWSAQGLLILIPLCCAPTNASLATAVQTNGITACSIFGWSSDKDPAGLNIRSAPGKDARIIGRIPREKAQGGDSYAAEFAIIGSQDGWLLVRNVRFADYGDGKGDRVVFTGPGWVYADKVRFLINENNLRSAADRASPVIMKLVSSDHTAGPDSANIDHVYGCRGDFADIAVHMNGPTMRGWATGICSNQVTTCP